MKIKYIIFILLNLVSLFLFSCAIIPCKKQLTCVSYKSEATITIRNNQNLLLLELKENDQLKNDISDYSNGIITIRTPFLFYAYEFGEYDHWFPVKHKIKIEIYSDHVIYDSGNLRMLQIADTIENYDTYLNQ